VYLVQMTQRCRFRHELPDALIERPVNQQVGSGITGIRQPLGADRGPLSKRCRRLKIQFAVIRHQCRVFISSHGANVLIEIRSKPRPRTTNGFTHIIASTEQKLRNGLQDRTDKTGIFKPAIFKTGQYGAGEGNRTLVFSLEGCCSTIELHPRAADQLSRPASRLNLSSSGGNP
jgi:hypothetical protein